MKAYEVTAIIQAAPESIWAIITDAASLARWDSGIERIDGRIGPGSKITIYSKVNPSRGFPTTVSDFLPGRSMRWSGGMPLGLFKGGDYSCNGFVLICRAVNHDDCAR